MATAQPTPNETVPPLPPTEGIEVPLIKAPLKTPMIVTRVELDGDDAVRLKRMGLCMGRRIEIQRHGDPLILLAAGARLGLSSRLAKQVRAAHAAGCCQDPSFLKPEDRQPSNA